MCDTNGSVWISEAIQVRLEVSLAPRKGFFLSFCVSSGIGIESTFRHLFRAPLTVTAWVNSAEHVNKLTIKTLISIPNRRWSMKASVSVVCMDLFITETTVHQEVHANDGHSVQTGVYTNKYHVIGSSHRSRLCFRHKGTETLSNAAAVTVFFSSSFAEFSIKVCLLCKNKSHRMQWPEGRYRCLRSLGARLMLCSVHVLLPASGVITKLRWSRSSRSSIAIDRLRALPHALSKKPIFFQTKKLQPSPLPNKHRSFETKGRQMATAPKQTQAGKNISHVRSAAVWKFRACER